MRVLTRNKQVIYYANLDKVTPIYDDNGNLTGDEQVTYSEPIRLKAVVSMTRGGAESTLFGLNEVYDKYITLNKEDDVITEQSVLWIGIEPDEPYNYKVYRVAKSLNFIQIGIRRVEAPK